MLQRIILALLLTVFIGCSSTSDEVSDIDDAQAGLSDSFETDDGYDTLDESDLLGEDLVSEEDSLDQEIASLGDEESSLENDEFAEFDFATEDTFFDENAGNDMSADNMGQMTDDFASAPQPEISQETDFTQESESFFNDNAETTAMAAAPTGPASTVTKLDFLANQNGGTIVITTDGPVTYTTRSNPETKQFIVEIPNANLPKKFQRPYNTNEFNGAIGLFQGYQNPDGNVARFVVQMDQDGEPLVQQEGNNLLIIASGAGVASSEMMSDMEEQQGEWSASPPPPDVIEVAPSEPAVASGNAVMAERSIEDFLSGNTEFYGRQINIEVKDWDIRDVFDFIAEQSGLNIVLAEEVTGKISLKLRDVPWDQALFVVMQSKQLGYKRQGSIVRVAPLSSLRAETDAAKQVLDSQRLLQPMQVKIVPVSYAKARDLEQQVKDFLTPNRGKVKADERTNSLVITDIPEVIEKVTKLLQSLDTETPQVLIEAKIVEAKESLMRQVGVNWFGNGGSRSQGIVQPGRRVGASLGADVSSYFGSVTFGRAGADFIASFGILESEDLLKVLSSPRILGLNNVTSKIEQISDIPIKKSDNVNGSITETTTYIPVSLILEVTPQITSQGSVIMGLKLTREFVGEQGENDARPIFKRRANTTVVVNNGETAVIGGVYQSDDTSQDKGIPFLSKIPILGYLFKSESRTKEKNELMMFVTPRIMNFDKAFVGDRTEEDLIEEQSDFL